MAEKHNLKIEVLEPTDIEAEVPRHQKLRVPSEAHPSKEQNVSDGKVTIRQGDTVETYAPVITVTTEESNFGKNGLKFQRVTVTEDISVNFQHLFKKETKAGKTVVTQDGSASWNTMKDLMKPAHVGEPVRKPPRVWRHRGQDYSGEDKTSQEEKKAKTRIPVSRFKPAVAKVLRERKYSGDGNEHKSKKETPEKPPRRSSIPKLSDRILAARKNAFKSDANERTTVNNDKESVNVSHNDEQMAVKISETTEKVNGIPGLERDLKITTENHLEPGKKDIDEDQTAVKLNLEDDVPKQSKEQLDDEFDKLYEEIVDTEVENIPDEILDTKVKDPEKLEIKFEEIVHQYDEETIEQVKVEPTDKARYSKIPLLKRKSEQEIKVPKRSDRRFSLKTGISTNKITRTKNDENTNEETLKRKNDFDKEVDETEKTDDGTEINAQKDSSITMNDSDNSSVYLIESPNAKPAFDIMATPDAELVKVGLSEFDVALERTIVNRSIVDTHVNDNATPEPETVKVPNLGEPIQFDIRNQITQDFETGEIKEVGYIIEEPISIHETHGAVTEYLIDKPEVTEFTDSSVTLVNEDIVTNNNENKVKTEETDDNDTVRVATITFETEPIELETQNDIAIPISTSEFKSVQLLINKNAVEERTKSRFINKPLNKEKYNSNYTEPEEEIPIVRGKVGRILKRLASHENISNDQSTDNTYKPSELDLKSDIPLQRKVSKLINRIALQETDDVKKEFDDIPKKQSVLSKIAMFERAAPEPFPKKTGKYSKPKRTISEEVRHSPKIVQEVLKQNITNGQTKKPYEVVTIDILKPVEVITNSEEQVLVVENLKEESVVYENLDDLKQAESFSIEDDSISQINTDQNEQSTNSLEIDDNRVFKVAYEHYEPKRLRNTDQIKTLKDIKPNSNVESKDKWENQAVLDYVPVKEKINRLTSYEETNMRRAKSTAELDLGDAVKGKVKNMIVRMNSFDILDDNKQREAISIKERPIKRTVSEKIALFEKKLTPVKMDEVKVVTGRALNIDSKPKADSVITLNDSANVTRDEEYNAKIRELTSAKLTYGSHNMSFLELRDGRKIPALALGTALLNPRLVKYIVSAAIDLGYRAIDTAFIYGNEKEVGEGIRAKIQDGTVKREDLFILNKLWSTFHRPDLVESACRASLRALGLEYFDLFMIHNPMSFKEGGDPVPKIANVLQFSAYDYMDAWFAMEGLVSRGLVRSIGVSNFNSVQLARVLEKGRVKPVINQVECHPYLSQQRLSDFCDARDVRLSCFGVLGSKGTPDELKGQQEAAIDDPLVQVLAAGLGISPAQLLIRYQLECGHHVVVKGSSAAHMWDNLQALGVTLESTQVDALHALNRNKRTFTFKGMGDTHRNYPFKIPF